MAADKRGYSRIFYEAIQLMIKNNPRQSAAEKYDTVILAAGLSSRMGSFKPLMPYGQSTLIETVVDAALEVSERIILVVGHRSPDIINLKHWDERVIIAINEQYEKGMFSSVKVGAALVKSPRFFIVLGDQPQISMSVYQQLLAAETADVIQPAYKGKNGHPILLGEKVREAILAADENDPDTNLRNIIDGFPKRIVKINDPGILIDLDTPEDYNRGECE